MAVLDRELWANTIQWGGWELQDGFMNATQLCLSICLEVIATEEDQCSSEDLTKCPADMTGLVCWMRFKAEEMSMNGYYNGIKILLVDARIEWFIILGHKGKKPPAQTEEDDGWGPAMNRMINNLLHLWDKALTGSTKHLSSQQKPNLTQPHHTISPKHRLS